MDTIIYFLMFIFMLCFFSAIGFTSDILFLFMCNLMSAFLILKPLSEIIASEKMNSKTTFIVLFIFKLFLSFLLMPIFKVLLLWEIMMGIFLLNPLLKRFKKGGSLVDIKMTNNLNVNNNSPAVSSTTGQNINLQANLESPQQGTPVAMSEYPSGIYDVDKYLAWLINEEFIRNNVDKSVNILEIEKRKCIFTFVYVLILFICISLCFFHVGFAIVIIIFIIITSVYISLMKKYNNVNYLIKEIKSRPDEKISYVVANYITRIGNNKLYKTVRLVMFLLVIALTLFIYREPHMIFERQDDAYVVRFYTYGIFKNDKKLIIPSTYKDRDVVGIRGDVFANVYTIEEVVLPETIVEIRGGAFKNAKKLKEINLPEGIKEVKGNTFEGCESLETIYIPDGVSRIGGSAFRDCVSLSSARIPQTVTEIGSSAFRNTNLSQVCISETAYVNERAFKETITEIYYYESGCGSDYE